MNKKTRPKWFFRVVLCLGAGMSLFLQSKLLVVFYRQDESQPQAEAPMSSIGSLSASGHNPLQQQHPNNDDTRHPQPQRQRHLLALLYPPGLVGGYRNQVIRFLSLVVKAKEESIESSLFLPSLLWTTRLTIPSQENHNGTTTTEDAWIPVPHDFLFDVNYWNSYVYSSNNNNNNKSHQPRLQLPKLVDSNKVHTTTLLDACWTFPKLTNVTAAAILPPLAKETIQRGFLTPLANLSLQLLQQHGNPQQLRRLDALNENTKTCHDTASNVTLTVYGGGTGVGRLWKDYLSYQLQYQQGRNGQFYQAYVAILQALRPKAEWRTEAQRCVAAGVSKSTSSSYTTTTTTVPQDTSRTGTPSYLALHARVELDMMGSPCGQDMERNLTKLLNQVEDFVGDCNGRQHGSPQRAIEGIFVALSRSGLERTTGKHYQQQYQLANQNLQIFNHVLQHGLGDASLQVFECGKYWMDQYYAKQFQKGNTTNVLDYGTLLQSMIDFYVATESNVFIGVRGSAFSTDVWMTRYHQGKGHTNYEYTKDKGILLMGNDGLPPMHTKCKAKNKKK